MIDEEATFVRFGYRSEDIGLHSAKPVVVICDGCNEPRCTMKRYCTETVHNGLCRSCAMKNKPPVTKVTRDKMSKIAKNRPPISEATRLKMSESRKGKVFSDGTKKNMSESQMGAKNHRYGKRHTDEEKKALSVVMGGKNNPFYGRRHTKESLIKMSCTKQSIKIMEWDGFAKDGEYCHDFNNDCKEHNRDKYNRLCFLCGKDEVDNISKSGEYRKLSVHHIDRNKNQGCDGHDWKLVPLCMECHGMVHTPLWISRIEYIITRYGYLL